MDGGDPRENDKGGSKGAWVVWKSLDKRYWKWEENHKACRGGDGIE